MVVCIVISTRRTASGDRPDQRRWSGFILHSSFGWQWSWCRRHAARSPRSLDSHPRHRRPHGSAKARWRSDAAAERTDYRLKRYSLSDPLALPPIAMCRFLTIFRRRVGAANAVIHSDFFKSSSSVTSSWSSRSRFLCPALDESSESLSLFARTVRRRSSIALMNCSSSACDVALGGGGNGISPRFNFLTAALICRSSRRCMFATYRSL